MVFFAASKDKKAAPTSAEIKAARRGGISAPVEDKPSRWAIGSLFRNIATAYIAMACIAIAYIVMAYLVLAWARRGEAKPLGDWLALQEYSYGLYSYDLYSYGLYSYGLYSYGLYSYGLYSSGLYSYGLGPYRRSQAAGRSARSSGHDYMGP